MQVFCLLAKLGSVRLKMTCAATVLAFKVTVALRTTLSAREFITTIDLADVINPSSEHLL